uniref:Putative secreted protein n=1 Tax=Ixodes ricinus TaxID=34613 RepID=A0A6B0TZ89_IXORI
MISTRTLLVAAALVLVCIAEKWHRSAQRKPTIGDRSAATSPALATMESAHLLNRLVGFHRQTQRQGIYSGYANQHPSPKRAICGLL